MQFHGFQKLTLLDFPGKVACTLFTGGCNFRCLFCHNAGLVTHVGQAAYPEEAVLSYLEKRRGVLDGVCVTGGEPLLQAGLPAFLERVKALGYAVKLDTNGSFPDRLKALVAAGLVDYVAMDIKNAPEQYALTAGAEVDLASVEESVSFLLSGAVDYEFRTTLVAELHTAADMEAIGAWIRGAKRYFLQTFRDSGDLIGTGYSALPAETTHAFKEIAQKYVVSAQIRGE